MGQKERTTGLVALMVVLPVALGGCLRPPGESALPPLDLPGEGDHADVALRVAVDRGPHGARAPVPVPDHFYSFNLWQHNGWYPEADPEFVGMLRELRPGFLRWPAGHPGQDYWFDASGREEAPQGFEGWILTPQHLEALMAVSRAVGAEPLLEVNVKTGSPSNAAALVRHANQEMGYGIRWWQLGNEPDLDEDAHQGPGWITERSQEFARAMRQVDPAIRFVGPEIMTGADVMGIHGRENWMRPFAEANGPWIGALSWHWYPLDSEQPDPESSAHPTLEHFLQYEGENWRVSGLHFADEAMAEVRTLRNAHAPQAEIWVTEMGPDSGLPGAPGLTDSHAAAVWWADALGRMAGNGAGAVFQFAFKHWTDSRLTLVNDENEPIPPYLTWHLLSNRFRGDAVHAESTDDANVSAHAVARPDGSLAVLVVNKGADNRTARLDLWGTQETGTPEYYRIQAPGPLALESTLNGETVTKEALLSGKFAVEPLIGPARTDEAWELPGYSVTLIEFPGTKR